MNEQLLYVLIGGGLGSVGRYLISETTSNLSHSEFPWGTFIVNILGCLVIGILTAFLSPSGSLDAFFITGFCGGFTTFSSFSKEVFLFFDRKKIKLAVMYIALSTFFGILAVFLGYTLGGGHFE